MSEKKTGHATFDYRLFETGAITADMLMAQRDSGLVVPIPTVPEQPPEPAKLPGLLQDPVDREKAKAAIVDLINAVGVKESRRLETGRYDRDNWQAYLVLSGLLYNVSNTLLGELIGWEEKT